MSHLPQRKKKYLNAGILSFLLWLTSINVAAQSIQEFYDLATSSYDQGNYLQSVKYFEKIIEINPQIPQAYNGLGLAKKAINEDLSEVAWLFKKAIELDPDFAIAYDNLGKAYYGAAEYEKAEKYCKRAIELKADLYGAHLSLAWIYLLGKSKPSQAIHHFKEVLKYENLPNAHFGLGMAYFMYGDRAQALESITALRFLKQDQLATQLENMVRDRKFVAPADSGPLVKTQRQRSTLIDDDSSEQMSGVDINSDKKRGTPVRLSGPLLNFDSDAPDYPPEEGAHSAYSNSSPYYHSSGITVSTPNNPQNKGSGY